MTPRLMMSFHGEGTREGQPGETSAEIAKALGHPSAAGALLSTLSEHSSTVSAAGTPNAEASSPGKRLQLLPKCSDPEMFREARRMQGSLLKLEYLPVMPSP